MLNMADAVHVEGVEADLFRHRAAFSPWQGRNVICQCSGMSNGRYSEVAVPRSLTRAAVFLTAR
jgi:hypothetical protein